MKRVEHATERLEIRTAEAEAMEAEELQNALNQPPDGATAAAAEGGGGGEPAAAAADEGGASDTVKSKGRPCLGPRIPTNRPLRSALPDPPAPPLLSSQRFSLYLGCLLKIIFQSDSLGPY